jgi:pSer/pThr/pTyr-binding forkhead associated (FHA) protein
VPARIRLSTGQVVDLGRPVLIGRAPQVTRVAFDELPALVTVPSPTADISRTHVQVRQDGDDVLVTDLHSTNGVLVTWDGAPLRLHPGEPVAIGGGVVDLGDGVTFTVEPPRERG